MAQFFETWQAQVILYTALFAVLMAILAYTFSAARRGLRDRSANAGANLTNFRELREQGELTEKEYRTIKAMLAGKLQEELKNKERPG